MIHDHALELVEAAAAVALIVAAVRHFNAHGCLLPPWVDGIWALLGGSGAALLCSVAGLPLDPRWPMATGLLAAGALAGLNRRRGDLRRSRNHLRRHRPG